MQYPLDLFVTCPPVYLLQIAQSAECPDDHDSYCPKIDFRAISVRAVVEVLTKNKFMV